MSKQTKMQAASISITVFDIGNSCVLGFLGQNGSLQKFNGTSQIQYGSLHFFHFSTPSLVQKNPNLHA